MPQTRRANKLYRRGSRLSQKMRGGAGTVGLGQPCRVGTASVPDNCSANLVCDARSRKCIAAPGVVVGRAAIGRACIVNSKVATTKCVPNAVCNPTTRKCDRSTGVVGTVAVGKTCVINGTTPATKCAGTATCNPTTRKCVAAVVGRAVIGAPCQVGSTVAATKCAGTATCSATTKKCVAAATGTTTGTVTAIKMQITLANLKANRNAIEAAAGSRIVGVANSSGVKQQLGGALVTMTTTPTLIVAFNGTIDPTRLNTAVKASAALKKVIVGVDTRVTPVPLSIKPVTATGTATGTPTTTPTTRPPTTATPFNPCDICPANSAMAIFGPLRFVPPP